MANPLIKFSKDIYKKTMITSQICYWDINGSGARSSNVLDS